MNEQFICSVCTKRISCAEAWQHAVFTPYFCDGCWIKELTAQLHQRDAALVSAREALELLRPVREQMLTRTKTTEAFDRAISEISTSTTHL